MIYLYNDNTLIKVEPNGLLFITIMPLLQKSRISFSENEDEYIKDINKIKKDIIKRLEGFVGDRLKKKGTGGAIYKLISHFEKYTPVQKYILTKPQISKFTDKEEEADLFDFLRKKELIELQNFYNRKDFLVINTYFPKEKLLQQKLISKKQSIYTFFSEIKDEAHYKKVGNIFKVLHNIHFHTLLLDKTILHLHFFYINQKLFYTLLFQININPLDKE